MVQNWCMSPEGIPQEVFCVNNTTRNSVVELKKCVTPCVCEFGKHFQNSLGSGGSGFSCHLCNTKDSKGRRVVSIVRKSGKHSQNLLSLGGDVFLVLPMHHQ